MSQGKRRTQVKFEDHNNIGGLLEQIKDDLEEGLTSIINSARERK